MYFNLIQFILFIYFAAKQQSLLVLSVRERLERSLQFVLVEKHGVLLFFLLPGAVLQEQQSKQRCPGFPLPRLFFRLLHRNTMAFSGQARNMPPPRVHGRLRVSSQWEVSTSQCIKKTSSVEGQTGPPLCRENSFQLIASKILSLCS